MSLVWKEFLFESCSIYVGDVSASNAIYSGNVSASTFTATNITASYIVPVSTLPSSPFPDKLYRLTTNDSSSFASPGYYVYDGNGWFCNNYSSLYDLGNLSGSISQSFISGLEYKASLTDNVTTFSASLSRTGRIGITLTNSGSSYGIIQPIMAERTSSLLSSTAWNDSSGSLTKIILEDDGTYIISSITTLS